MLPTVEVEVTVSVVPRRCGCARKHSHGREHEKRKFPCHDGGSSELTSEEIIDQRAGCSKRRSRKMRDASGVAWSYPARVPGRRANRLGVRAP